MLQFSTIPEKEPFEYRQTFFVDVLQMERKGRGGISAVAGATGVARKTIVRGLQELKSPSRAGVVRRIAKSDHWRWVSMPR